MNLTNLKQKIHLYVRIQIPAVYALVVYPILMFIFFIFFGLLINFLIINFPYILFVGAFLLSETQEELEFILFVGAVLASKIGTLISEIFFFRSFENYLMLEQKLYEDYFNGQITAREAQAQLEFIQGQFEYFDDFSFYYEKENRIKGIIDQEIVRKQNEQTFATRITKIALCFLGVDPQAYYKGMLTLKSDFPELNLQEFFIIRDALEKDFFEGKLTREAMVDVLTYAINKLSVFDLLFSVDYATSFKKELVTIAFTQNLHGDVLTKIFIIYEPKSIEITWTQISSLIKNSTDAFKYSSIIGR